MAFLVFRRPKMIEKKYAALILAVEFKSEEKSSLSILEKNNFCSKQILGKSIKIVKLNFTIKINQSPLEFSGTQTIKNTSKCC